MAVVSHNMTATIKNRLRTPRLVIIEFLLEELSDTGHTGRMLHLSLSSNYTMEKQKDIHLERITFDLKNEKARIDHQRAMLKRVRILKEKYVSSFLQSLQVDPTHYTLIGTPLITQWSLFTRIQMMLGVTCSHF